MARPTPEELAERRRQMDAVNSIGGGGGAAPQQMAALAPDQAQTYPEGAKPGPGLQTSTPSPSGGNATEGGTPVPDGANGSQDGGVDLIKDRGTPDQMIDKMPAGELESSIERSITAVANGQTPAVEGALPSESDPDMQAAAIISQKDKVNKTMEAVGGKPETALEQLRDKRLAEYERMHNEGLIDKNVHTKLRDRWKNIFNIIPKEDMGLVLMDFGFRAMMAGETMGSAAALGAAGSGALAGVQQREKDEYGRKVEQFNMADEGAREDLGALEKAPDTINTEEGIYKWDAETQRYVAVTDPETGEKLQPSSTAVRPPADKWQIDQWMSAFPGMTEQEATRRAMSGVTPEQARLQAEASFDRAFSSGEMFIPGKGRVKARDVTDAQREAYIEQRVRGYGYNGSDGGALSDGGGGGGGGGLADPEQRATDKPTGMSASDWKEYNAMWDEIEKMEGKGAL